MRSRKEIEEVLVGWGELYCNREYELRHASPRVAKESVSYAEGKIESLLWVLGCDIDLCGPQEFRPNRIDGCDIDYENPLKHLEIINESKPPLFCQACGEIDGELHRWWLELRDDGTKRDHVAASIEFVYRLGLLSEDSRELWLRRIATCPGHDDEGGRSWCAYCGDIEREEDGSGA